MKCAWASLLPFSDGSTSPAMKLWPQEKILPRPAIHLTKQYLKCLRKICHSSWASLHHCPDFPAGQRYSAGDTDEVLPNKLLGDWFSCPAAEFPSPGDADTSQLLRHRAVNKGTKLFLAGEQSTSKCSLINTSPALKRIKTPFQFLMTVPYGFLSMWVWKVEFSGLRLGTVLALLMTDLQPWPHDLMGNKSLASLKIALLYLIHSGLTRHLFS